MLSDSNVCRKTFYNIRHFYGFSHNLLQKNESHSVLFMLCAAAWVSLVGELAQKKREKNVLEEIIKVTMSLIVSLLRASSAGD